LTLIIIGILGSAPQVLTQIIIENFAFAPQGVIKIKFQFLINYFYILLVFLTEKQSDPQ